MKLSDRQATVLAGCIIEAEKLLDNACEGTISREEFVNIMLSLQTNLHGLNSEFIGYGSSTKTN